MNSESATVDENAEHWQKSFEAKLAFEEGLFRSIPLDVLRDVEGQFIALSDGKIIDHDWNELTLAKRVSLLPKTKFILIHQVVKDDLQRPHV
jgi:hypothetical protein